MEIILLLLEDTTTMAIMVEGKVFIVTTTSIQSVAFTMYGIGEMTKFRTRISLHGETKNVNNFKMMIQL